MKVKLMQSLEKNTITSVEGFVGKALVGDVYDSSTERTAYNCAEALARMCDVLADKGILSLPDVVYIAKGYKNSDMLEKVEE